jgi:hypothetical protein
MLARSRAAPFLLLASMACAATRGPSGYLKPAEITQREAHGGWITLFLAKVRVDGELIAVGADSVFVLMPTALRVVPRDSVRSAILGGYHSQKGGPAGWTVAGTVGTLSHGLVLGATAPLWIITGSLLTASISRAPLISVSRDMRPDEARARWAAIATWARFPAGMPAALDRATLRSRRPRSR